MADAFLLGVAMGSLLAVLLGLFVAGAVMWWFNA